MNIKITYPAIAKRKLQRKKLLNILRWPFLAAAFSCPVVNLATGGKAWSVIALMGLYMVWRLVFAVDLVEYNRISQFTKLITWSSLLLALIDYFLASGWAIEVVPIVCFGGLIVAGTLFFTDFQRQKQNVMPMLWLIFLALVGATLGLSLWHGRGRWAMIVMGALAFVLLVACIATMGRDFIRELKKRFHVK